MSSSTGWPRKWEHGVLFIINHVLLIRVTRIVWKVVKSFNQDVQCVRHDLQSLITDDPALIINGINNAVVTCEIKLFQNYFRRLLQLMNTSKHVQCRWNNFRTLSAAELIIPFPFQTWLRVKQKLSWNNCEIILVFYLTCNHRLSRVPNR